jgi:D-3-phosphoglycerate dehydrogenase
MKKRIALLNNISSIVFSAFPSDRYEVGKEVGDPHGIIVRSADCSKMAFGPSLLAIARAGVGYNNIPVDSCTENGICVFNTPGANANAVKELLIASMIMASRNVFEAVVWAKGLSGAGVEDAVEKGKNQFVGGEIKGKKLGVVGLGAIGVMVANDALALGMEVMGYDPFITIEAAWTLNRNIRRANSLEELASVCDFISVHVPLAEKTRGIISEDIIAKMKKGAVLLNLARGGLVNTAALKTALESGSLHKYVTDFPDEETLLLPNCICIPHLGASTPESEENCAQMASDQLYDYLQTGNIKNSVNLPSCELPPYEGGRLTFIHTNTPNMVGQITTALAKEQVNIAHMINRSSKSIAYTMIDVDQPVSSGQLDRIQAIEGLIRLRVIKSAY